MKKIYLAILFSTLLFVSCNKQDFLVEDVPTIPNDILGDDLRLASGGCFFDKVTQMATDFSCENLGKIELTNTVANTVSIMPLSKESPNAVYLVFTEYGEDLNIQKHEFKTAEGNDDYFNLKVYFLDKDNIYVWDRTGGEGSDGRVIAFYRSGAWYEWYFHDAVETNLPPEYKDGDYGVVFMSVSDPDNEIKLGVRIGEGYGDTINYLLTFDSETFEFKKIEEKQKPEL